MGSNPPVPPIPKPGQPPPQQPQPAGDDGPVPEQEGPNQGDEEDGE